MQETRYIIDSHAHLMKEYFGEDLTAVIERAREAGVIQLVNPCVSLNQIPELIELAEHHSHLFLGIGLHPHEAKTWNSESALVLRKAVSHDKVVAIGECGLDFFYDHSDREVQVAVFKEQVKLARKVDKPIIVHCRDAWEDTLTILEQHGGREIRGVFHCFTGEASMLPRIQELDFYVSFSGIVTFHNALKIQTASTLVSTDRILVETDCPFLAPQKMRGRRNEPAYVWMVAEKLAELRRAPLLELSKTLCHNARNLFRLPEPADLLG